MLSLSQTLRLRDLAREAYAEGVKYERSCGRRSFRLGHATDLLLRIINENEVAISTSAWDRFEGLMDGDLDDVKDAFRLLGGYAQVGINHVDLGA